MDSVNFWSIAKAFIAIIKDKFDEEDEEPTEDHFEIAHVLVEKLEKLAFTHGFVDEHENVQGGIVSDCNFVDEETGTIVVDEIPFKSKQKALEDITNHPNWTFATIKQRHPYLKFRSDISVWRKQIAIGATKYVAFRSIEDYVISKFNEARSEFLTVHDFDLKRWAMQKANQYPGLFFKASKSWLACLKNRNGISSRKIQKFVSFRAIRDREEILNKAADYRNQILPIIEEYSPIKVWNTDQTGFKYEILSTRTLSHTGEKLTLGASSSPKNKATHSYTMQYIISLGGTIIGDAFLCLQEQNGRFGPQVEKSLFSAPNLTVSCSKSGKLTKVLVEEFLEKIVAPHAMGSVLYLLDKWGGHTDSSLYNRFVNEDCNMRVSFIPENCTDLVQPLDTYFHRELKYVIKQFYNYAILHGDDQLYATLTSRNGIIKLQSLTHFILSSPKFQKMIEYCWFSSGLLVGERPDFLNVKGVCFELGQMICSDPNCDKPAFIKCSWCENLHCFESFYNAYHLRTCPNSPYNFVISD